MKFLVLIILIILTIAFYIVLERKLMATVQHRYGPNLVGFQGSLQQLADGLKLLVKEIILPQRSFLILFLFAPFFNFLISFQSFSFIQYEVILTIVEFNYWTILQLMVFLSINVYGVILSGQASNSRYPFIGSLRSISQLLSYELIFSFIFLIICLKHCSFTIDIIINEQLTVINLFLLFPLFCFYIISILVETNRAPFDLPEAEAEIVAGYNLEYSAIFFALFFLGEYGNMIFLSLLGVIFFLGGQLPVINNFCNIFQFQLSLKSLLFIYLFILIRATFPRCRYDQLLFLSQHILLPLLISYFFFIFSLVSCFYIIYFYISSVVL